MWECFVYLSNFLVSFYLYGFNSYAQIANDLLFPWSIEKHKVRESYCQVLVPFRIVDVKSKTQITEKLA